MFWRSEIFCLDSRRISTRLSFGRLPFAVRISTWSAACGREPNASALSRMPARCWFCADEDDACPKHRGPEMAHWLRQLGLPFPSAVVLLHPEYEVVFLPCLDLMAGKPLDGRPGLDAGTVWDGASWEAKRGVKEWLSHHFPRNRRYKPTLDQLPMTRMLDFDRVRKAEVPCFGTLERAVTFLNRSRNAGDVYPRLPLSGRSGQH